MSPDNDARNPRNRKARGKPAQPAKLTFDQYRFCRLELTETEKDDCKESYFPGETPIGVLTDLVIPGYKVSCAFDKDGVTHICSITCNDPSDPNAGLTITARARDVSTAIMVLGYKILVVCDNRPWAEVEAERGGRYSDIG